jgi:hypothetical protein
MPHIREALARDVRSEMRAGVSMERKFWPDTETPHQFLGSFPHPDHVLNVTFNSAGLATVTKRYRDHVNGKPGKISVYWAPDDVIAIVEMKPFGISGVEQTYAHHDDRLYLPNGHLQAHPGTMHKVWDVYHDDPFIGPTLIAAKVSVLDGRKRLAELTP